MCTSQPANPAPVPTELWLCNIPANQFDPVQNNRQTVCSVHSMHCTACRPLYVLIHVIIVCQFVGGKGCDAIPWLLQYDLIK